MARTKGDYLWAVEKIRRDALRSAQWEADRALITNRLVSALGVKRVPTSLCTTCGTDPKDDLYPRVGALCHWCDELKNIHQAQLDKADNGWRDIVKQRAANGRSGDLGPMRTSRRGTESTGPRRAPAIPSTRVRQRADTIANVALCAYILLMVIVFGFMGVGS